MKRAACLLIALGLVLPPSLFADFQYQETTKITGGTMVTMMKLAGVFSKQARNFDQPVTSTVLIKGNRMAHINQDYTQIIDLDKETITHIDHVKKEYSVMTFQQLKQQIEQAAEEAKKRQAEQGARGAPSPDAQAEMNFQANVRNTGATKQLSGLNTREAILAMTAEVTDKKTGQKGTFAITNDMWMTPEIPGYSEVRDFYQKWAQKMGMILKDAMSQQMAAMQPGMAQGYGEMAKEMSKLKGMPVLEVVRMGSTPDGKPLPAASEAPLPPSPEMPSAGEVAKQSATSAIASKIGLGGFGHLGRKKKEEPQQPKDQQAAQQNQQTGPAVLVETNTELSGFSTASVEASRLGVPAGYKQVEPQGVRQSR